MYMANAKGDRGGRRTPVGEVDMMRFGGKRNRTCSNKTTTSSTDCSFWQVQECWMIRGVRSFLREMISCMWWEVVFVSERRVLSILSTIRQIHVCVHYELLCYSVAQSIVGLLIRICIFSQCTIKRETKIHTRAVGGSLFGGKLWSAVWIR